MHQQAADNIFTERNSESRLKSGILDLHGLHDNECIPILTRTLSQYKGPVLKVITGTGHHSRLGYASIEPAIRQYLQSTSYRYAQGKMSDGRGGLFTIYLS